MQKTIFRLVWIVLEKILKVVCCCFIKSEDENVKRARQQKEREKLGIDSWSDDFIAESHVGQLHDFWERFQMERSIIADRWKSNKRMNA